MKKSVHSIKKRIQTQPQVSCMALNVGIPEAVLPAILKTPEPVIEKTTEAQTVEELKEISLDLFRLLDGVEMTLEHFASVIAQMKLESRGVELQTKLDSIVAEIRDYGKPAWERFLKAEGK